jgi:iron complex outermembrane receptor protein
MSFSRSFVVIFLRKESRIFLTFLFSLLIYVGVQPERAFAHDPWQPAGTVPDGYVRGRVTAGGGDPLPGVSVQVQGTLLGTTTDASGHFQLRLADGSYMLRVSFVGYETQVQQITVGGTDQVIDFVLKEGASALDEVVVLGSRSAVARTNIEKPVPVDVIRMKEIGGFAQADVTQMLNYSAPSFSSNRQALSDGTDHIDPASLRGLGPDQVLMLVNGKRRHTTALVNINGTFGRGTVGSDLNAIPAAAIERIEVLRDGAAAQYGSDAIAGVINVVLKKNTPFVASYAQGQSLSHTLGQDFRDGKTYQFDLSKGFSLGSKGYINLSGQLLSRDATNRGGPDTRPLLYTGLPTRGNNETQTEFEARYAMLKAQDDARAAAAGLDRNSMIVGNSQNTNIGAFLNGEYALGTKATAYLAMGFGHRKGKGAGFYRLPSQSSQIDVTLYPNGFLPFINTTIIDFSVIAGVRGELGAWQYDVSNTFGTNSMEFDITNTLNASLPSPSPTEFYAGKLQFRQNTINIDVSRRLVFGGILRALSMGYGAEVRLDGYQIHAGELWSYSHGVSEEQAGPANKAAGAQVFPGFRPGNEVDKSRNNKGVYADFEGEFGTRVLLGIAGRYENYSDFGSNFSYKATGRFKILEELALRGGIATGFRAPSLHQRYFSNESTQFVAGLPTQVLTVNNDNNIVRQFGVGSLKPELSISYSVGITGALLKNLTFTIDAYQIDIDDRIVFSSQYARERDINNNQIPTGTVNQILNTVDAQGRINSIQFFTNAIDTRTRGLDIVLSDRIRLGAGQLILTAASNVNKTTVERIQGSDVIEGNAGLKARLFDRLERSRYESAVPRSKVNLSANYSWKKLGLLARTVRFGEVTFLNAIDPTVPANNLPLEMDQTFSARWITDVSVSYRVIKSLNITVGANNLFDVYPDKMFVDPRNNAFNFNSDPALSYPAARDNTSNGHFLYSRNVSQFGFNGRYVFARLTFELP